MKLNGFKKIIGVLRCNSGLHIGGSAEQIEIGGVDLPIIKHPVTGEPYIPGSSLKGKMRCQLEKKEGKFGLNKKKEPTEPCKCGEPDCLVCKIFGSHQNTGHNLGSTRIIVRDSCLSVATKEEYSHLLEEKGLSFIEKKTENIINRKSGAAEHPRSLERIPAGAEFDIEIVLQEYEGDNISDMIEFVKEGLRLVQQTYLGGFGSRGSGNVSFHELQLDGTPFIL